MAEAAAAPAEGAAPPAPKKGMMIGLLVAGIVAGGAAGTFVVAPKLAPPIPTIAPDSGSEHGEEPAKEGEAGGEHGKKGEGEGEAPKMVTLDNIIVNPAGSQGSRFLMTSVAIATEDEKLQEGLKDRQVELRDKITTVLEVMTLQQLTAPGARDSVKARIQTMVVSMLGGKPKLKVFVPQFVIQ